MTLKSIQPSFSRLGKLKNNKKNEENLKSEEKERKKNAVNLLSKFDEYVQVSDERFHFIF